MSRTAKGSNLVNIIQLENDEKVTAMISVTSFPEDEYLTMVTRRGVIKRTPLARFAYQRKGGKIAIKLDEGDSLIFVRHTRGDESLLIATRDGLATRFDETNVRVMGRVSRGVRGIRLSDGDSVAGVAVVDETKKLLTITEGGMGKRTDFSEFRQMKNRGGSGVICHKITEKSGKLASVATVADDDDVMLITNEGTVIRIAVGDINVYSRGAAGVIVMRLSEGCFINTFARIEKQEEIDSAEAEIEAQNIEEIPEDGEGAPTDEAEDATVSDSDDAEETDSDDTETDDSDDGEV